MYYIVNDSNGQILEATATQPDVQAEANRFQCPVYVIKGQHTGLSAAPEVQLKLDIEPEITKVEMSAKLEKWKAG